jgi:hypothetical protein
LNDQNTKIYPENTVTAECDLGALPSGDLAKYCLRITWCGKNSTISGQYGDPNTQNIDNTSGSPYVTITLRYDGKGMVNAKMKSVYYTNIDPHEEKFCDKCLIQWGSGDLEVENASGVTSENHQYTENGQYKVSYTCTCGEIAVSDEKVIDITDITPVPPPSASGLLKLEVNDKGDVTANLNPPHYMSGDVEKTCKPCRIKWGDDIVEGVTGEASASHIYKENKKYTVRYECDCPVKTEFEEKDIDLTPFAKGLNTPPGALIFLFVWVGDNVPDNLADIAEDGTQDWIHLTPLTSCTSGDWVLYSSAPLTKCKDKVCFTVSDKPCPKKANTNVEDDALDCASEWRYSYTKIVAFTDHDIGDRGGYSCINCDYTVIKSDEKLSVRYMDLMHELGHSFGLCDDAYGSAKKDIVNGKNCPSGWGNCPSYDCACEEPDYCCPNIVENRIMCSDGEKSCKDHICQMTDSFGASALTHLSNELSSYCPTSPKGQSPVGNFILSAAGSQNSASSNDQNLKGFDVVYSLKADVYADDRILIKNVTAVYDDPSHFPSAETGYKVRLRSFDGVSLFEENLRISFMQTDSDIKKDKYSLILRIPSFPTAKEISVYHNEKAILEVNLTELCNKNKVCDPGENAHICPEDCTLKTSEDYVNNKKTGNNIMIVVATLILAVTFMFSYKKYNEHKIRKQKEEFDLWKTQQEEINKKS